MALGAIEPEFYDAFLRLTGLDGVALQAEPPEE